MKVLSVKQPWASLILEFGKNVENRSRFIHHDGPLVIASSATPDTDREDVIKTVKRCLTARARDRFLHCWNAGHFVNGCLLGGVYVMDIRREDEQRFSEWADPAAVQYVLVEPRLLPKPIPAKGWLGFWDVPKRAVPACVRLFNGRIEQKKS